nr:hypothetical protein Itr_chr06CG14930 [Ipomoea trifida]GME07574.1 hypothetical protein Iba_scaffold6363CG0010 [Ipomoea batatas]
MEIVVETRHRCQLLTPDGKGKTRLCRPPLCIAEPAIDTAQPALLSRRGRTEGASSLSYATGKTGEAFTAAVAACLNLHGYGGRLVRERESNGVKEWFSAGGILEGESC